LVRSGAVEAQRHRNFKANDIRAGVQWRTREIPEQHPVKEQERIS